MYDPSAIIPVYEIDMSYRTGKAIVCYSRLKSIKCSSTVMSGESGAATNCLLAISMSLSGRPEVRAGTGSPINGNLTSFSLRTTPSHTSGQVPGIQFT